MNLARPVPAECLLAGLNHAQLKAVQFKPDSSVQILAGPGSGKTKVLTTRIAYMILEHGIPPSSICAVTFTNKAANEMRRRLQTLIGLQRTEQLKMGTFHGLCAYFLRIHASLVGLDANFTICDAEESRKFIAAIIKKHKTFIDEKQIGLSNARFQAMISKAKAKGKSPADILEEATTIQTSNGSPNPRDRRSTRDDVKHIVGLVYEEYELTLRRNNSLDFDDLLLYGVKLFSTFKQTISWCNYVLVDEFQDTNTTQYSLMISLAIEKNVTVVGDPDQSIYGWRSAEAENLANMCRDFPDTQQILLEQNYRSTASILKASLAIVSQDKNRIQKTLHTSHPSGATPVLRSFPSDSHAEALFIATEIKKLIAHMGGALSWGDVAILLRFNALSRVIESALQTHGIPNRVLRGHKFFEREEVKSILAYLQLVDNPNFNPALVRASNVPSRGIGKKTLEDIAARSERSKVSQLSIMEGICDGRLPDLKPSAKQKLLPFVSVIRTLRDLADKGTSPADLIRRLVDIVGFEDYLKKTEKDWESDWENVKELIVFATEVAANIALVEEQSGSRDLPKDTPLRSFLQASMLTSEGDNQSEEESMNKVTISTCHAAKGLEWPVVFIPSVEKGVFPFHMSKDEEEERRLLYVACTRAQVLLYLTHGGKRSTDGDKEGTSVSKFISDVQLADPTLFTDAQPTFLPVDRKVICDILNRSLPDDAEVARRVTEFERTTPHYPADDFGGRPPPPSNNVNGPTVPIDLSVAFTSSSTMLQHDTSGVAPTSSNPTAKSQSKPNLPTTLASGKAPPTKRTLMSYGFGDSTDNSRTGTVLSSPHGFEDVLTTVLKEAAQQPFDQGSTTTPLDTSAFVSTPQSVEEPLQSISGEPVPTTSRLNNKSAKGLVLHLAGKLRLHPLLRQEGRPANETPTSLTTVAPLPKPSPVVKVAPSESNVSQGMKRRLGMGRSGGGYTNKKFKPPT